MYVVLTKYFSRVIAAQPGHITRLFGWGVGVVEKALESLVRSDIITDEVSITGVFSLSAGKWYIHTDYC
jgi:hypothetical protein